MILSVQIRQTGAWKGVKVTSASSFSNRNMSALLEVGPDGELYLNGEYKSRGWGAYNALVGPGDLSNDGSGDLMARDGAGSLYLYRGNGVDGFTPRVKVGTGYQVYPNLY
ncbi:hypothetical protein ACM614_29130 [Streptomyces sp. 12297]